MSRSYFKALFRSEIADVVAEPQRREAPRTPRARKPIGAKAQADRRDCSRKRVLK